MCGRDVVTARRGKVRADARISKQRQQEPPHAQTIEGRGVTCPGLVANDLSSSAWCQYIYFTGPHQVGASTISNQASSDQSHAPANEKRQQQDVVHFYNHQHAKLSSEPGCSMPRFLFVRQLTTLVTLHSCFSIE